MRLSGKPITLTCFVIFIISTRLFAYQNVHHRDKSVKLNIDSLFENAKPINETAEGHEVLQLCLKKYGGKEKLDKLKSMQLEYKMKPFFGNDSIDVVKYWAGNRKYKILKQGPNTAECRIIHGKKSWHQNKDTTVVIDGGRYNAELFSYLTLAMPLATETERFDDIRYGVRENDSLAYIYFKKNDSLIISLGIHPDDLTITSSEGFIFQGENKFAFKNIFSDYRKVDGFLIPYQLINISMGLEVARSRLEKVDINKELPDSIFDPTALPKPKNDI